MKQNSKEFREHLRRIGYKKGHTHPEEQLKRMSDRMKGNRIWDNENSRRHWFPRGVSHPDYRWKDLADLAEKDFVEFEKEMIRRDFHTGKINTYPAVRFGQMRLGEYEDELRYYKNVLVYAKHLENPTFLKHYNIVKRFEEEREKHRKINVQINGGFFTSKRKRSKWGATKRLIKENPELYKQYRISKVCFDRYIRFFNGKWNPRFKRNIVGNAGVVDLAYFSSSPIKEAVS